MISNKIYKSSTRLFFQNEVINTISNIGNNYLKTKKYEMSESHISPLVKKMSEEFVYVSEKPFYRVRIIHKTY